MLGRKGAGKRSLIDGLTDVSRTLYPKKSNDNLVYRQLRHDSW